MNNNIVSLNQSKLFIGIDLAKKIHVAKAIDINGIQVGYLSSLKNDREGFKTFDKEILNEISTVFLIIAFLSVLIQVLLGEGEEKALSASIIIKIIIFSPVLEELFNRCAVITILKTILKADNVVYMLISAVIFAMFHINSLKQSGFMPKISNLLIYFILGMGCAYVYLRTNNIVSAIVLHMFWNVSIVGGIISDIAHR